MTDLIDRNPSNSIYIFGAGPVAETLISAAQLHNPHNSYLDIGSPLMVVLRQRSTRYLHSRHAVVHSECAPFYMDKDAGGGEGVEGGRVKGEGGGPGQGLDLTLRDLQDQGGDHDQGQGSGDSSGMVPDENKVIEVDMKGDEGQVNAAVKLVAV
jgi:hypothetical protein